MSRYEQVFAELLSATMQADDASSVMPLYANALPPVLKDEGGYVNNPHDPGGATNYGITQKVYDAWRRNSGMPSRSVRVIGMMEVRAIYKEQYWDRVRGDDLPPGLDYCVFDFAVNSGPRRAIEGLQDALGVTVDGQFGAVTLAAARKYPGAGIIKLMCSRRLQWLKRITNKKGEKLWRFFGKGWTKRVEHVRAVALAMASTAPAKTSPAPDPSVAIPPPPDVPPVEPAPQDPQPIGFLALLVLIALAGLAATAFILFTQQ